MAPFFMAAIVFLYKDTPLAISLAQIINHAY